MAVARRGFVSIDCADPLPLAEFWAAMLGGEIMCSTDETGNVVWQLPLADPRQVIRPPSTDAPHRLPHVRGTAPWTVGSP